MIIAFSTYRICLRISIQPNNLTTVSVLINENFFIFDLLAVISGALTLIFLFHNRKRNAQFAHLPLLLHYVSDFSFFV